LGRVRLGDLDWRSWYRYVDRRFLPLGRAAGVDEYDREWNVDPTFVSSLTMVKSSAELAFAERSKLGAEGGVLQQGSTLEHVRARGSALLAPAKWPELSGAWETVRGHDRRLTTGNTNWERMNSGVTYDWRRLTPKIGATVEQYRGTQVRAFEDTTAVDFTGYEYSGELATQGLANGLLAGALGTTFREGQLTGEKYSNSYTTQARAALREWHALSQTWELTRRERTTFLQGAVRNKNQTTLLGFTSTYAPWQRAVSLDANYQATSTQSAQKREQFRKVGIGYGDYNLEVHGTETLYVAAPAGEYLREFVSVGTYRPTVRTQGGLNLNCQPRLFWRGRPNVKPQAWQQRLAQFSSAAEFTFEKTSRAGTDQTWQPYLPQGATPDTSRTLRESRAFRQDLTWAMLADRLSLRLRYKYQGLEDRENYPGDFGLMRTIREAGARVRTSPVRTVDNETEYRREIKEQQADAGRFFIQADEVSTTFFARYQQRTEVSFGGRVRREHDDVSGLASTLYALKPTARYALGGTGALSGDLDFIMVTDSTASYQMLEGNQKGWTIRWNALFDYRVNQYVTYYITYNGYNEPYLGDVRRTVHQGRAEVSATF
jgi:hypothetical protein